MPDGCSAQLLLWQRTLGRAKPRAARSCSGGLRSAPLCLLSLLVLPSACLQTAVPSRQLGSNIQHGRQDHGVEEQAVTVRDMERNGQTLDVTVAARPLQTGLLS